MSDRIAVCEMCGVTTPALGSRGRLPKRCPDCRRTYWNDWQREKKRLTDRRSCRVAYCVDCTRFIEILTRPGKPPLRCADCKHTHEQQNWRARRAGKEEAARAYHRAWSEQNIAKVRANSSKQAAKRRRAPRKEVTEREIARLLDAPCSYCGASPSEHIDHIIPLSRGGHHAIGNITGACAKCNLSKSNKLLVEWKHQPSTPERQRTP